MRQVWAGWCGIWAAAIAVGCETEAGALDAAGSESEFESESAVESAVESETIGEPPSKLGIDYAASPSGATPRYVASDATIPDWLDRPWPSDRWRTLTDGVAHIDLNALPFPEADLFQAYIAVGATLSGFGLNGAGYLAFDAALDPARLPDPATTRDDPRAPIQLVDLSPTSPTYGRSHPIELRVYEEFTSRWVAPHTLAFRPARGLPLGAGRTYCFVVARTLLDADGRYLQRATAFAAELAAGANGLAPLRDWLAAPSAPVAPPFSPIDLAAATCFTTDTPTAELAAIRAFLATQPAPAVTELHFQETRTFDGVAVDDYRGHYDAPNFQTGSAPYTNSGGAFVFGPDGRPEIQRVESMRYLLWVPATPQPPSGYPVVVYSHGTGGSWESCTRTAGPGPHVTPLGLAVLCIDQPGVGERGDGTKPDWINIGNPVAARTTMRQSAIDNLSLVRALRAGSFDIPASTAPDGLARHFDPDRIAFFGHSQGALTGALALALVPEFSGGVLSSAGGLITESALASVEAAPYLPALAAIVDDDAANLDTFHPVLSLLQMIGDASDPINYAPAWLASIDGFPARHVLMTSGTADPQTPIVTALALSAAGGLELANPPAVPSPAHALLAIAPVDLPARGNVATASGAVTAVQLTVLDGGHFVSSEAPYQATVVNFLQTLLTADRPTVAVTPAP